MAAAGSQHFAQTGIPQPQSRSRRKLRTVRIDKRNHVTSVAVFGKSATSRKPHRRFRSPRRKQPLQKRQLGDARTTARRPQMQHCNFRRRIFRPTVKALPGRIPSKQSVELQPTMGSSLSMSAGFSWIARAGLGPKTPTVPQDRAQPIGWARGVSPKAAHAMARADQMPVVFIVT